MSTAPSASLNSFAQLRLTDAGQTTSHGRDGRQRDDRLMGFAEPHVIRENRSTAPDQKTDPLNLVWVKALCNRLCAPAGFVVVYERQIVSNPMR